MADKPKPEGTSDTSRFVAKEGDFTITPPGKTVDTKVPSKPAVSGTSSATDKPKSKG